MYHELAGDFHVWPHPVLTGNPRTENPLLASHQDHGHGDSGRVGDRGRAHALTPGGRVPFSLEQPGAPGEAGSQAAHAETTSLPLGSGTGRWRGRRPTRMPLKCQHLMTLTTAARGWLRL